MYAEIYSQIIALSAISALAGPLTGFCFGQISAGLRLDALAGLAGGGLVQITALATGQFGLTGALRGDMAGLVGQLSTGMIGAFALLGLAALAERAAPQPAYARPA